MNVAEEKTKSLWMETAVAQAPALNGDRSADVVVIGSGIAGLSTAYELTGARPFRDRARPRPYRERDDGPNHGPFGLGSG